MVPHDCFSCAIRPRWVYTVRVGVYRVTFSVLKEESLPHIHVHISVFQKKITIGSQSTSPWTRVLYRPLLSCASAHGLYTYSTLLYIFLGPHFYRGSSRGTYIHMNQPDSVSRGNTSIVLVPRLVCTSLSMFSYVGGYIHMEVLCTLLQ